MGGQNRFSVIDLRKRPFFSGPLEMITRDGRRLGAAAIGVYCALDACRDACRTRGRVREAEVAALLDMTVDDVQAAITALIECGWLEAAEGEQGEEDTILALVSP